MSLVTQAAWLFLLAIPIACIAWTVTHEAIFGEMVTYCKARSQDCSTLLARKFFYLFTCEYCFSHYVTIAFLFLTRYKLLLDDWRGYIIAGFALVWVANIYMSLYVLIRLSVKHERIENDIAEKLEQNPEQRIIKG